MVVNCSYKLIYFLLIGWGFFNGRIAQADFLIGASTHSWQEKIPVIIGNQSDVILSSFSSVGIGLGYETLFQKRIRYGVMLNYVKGETDLHKIENANGPRRPFKAILLNNKIHWRFSKTFSFGPSVLYSSNQISEDAPVSTIGGYLEFDFDVFDNVRLTQALGSMSDSGQLAYSLTLSRIF